MKVVGILAAPFYLAYMAGYIALGLAFCAALDLAEKRRVR